MQSKKGRVRDFPQKSESMQSKKEVSTRKETRSVAPAIVFLTVPASKVKMDRYCFADISKNLLVHYDTIVRISTYILHYRSNIRHISQLAYYCGGFSLKFLYIGCILDVY